MSNFFTNNMTLYGTMRREKNRNRHMPASCGWVVRDFEREANTRCNF